jgi:hypothetical protein
VWALSTTGPLSATVDGIGLESFQAAPRTARGFGPIRLEPDSEHTLSVVIEGEADSLSIEVPFRTGGGVDAESDGAKRELIVDDVWATPKLNANSTSWESGEAGSSLSSSSRSTARGYHIALSAAVGLGYTEAESV